jgi:3-polyprenyl-4-hydroxybenzoate decarboxylase
VGYRDLREFIEQVDQLGALRRIDGADAAYEIGGVTEVAAGMANPPALLFDNIAGYKPGFRIYRSARRSRSGSIRSCGHSMRSSAGRTGAARSSRSRRAS